MALFYWILPHFSVHFSRGTVHSVMFTPRPCFYTPNETRGPQRARKISQEWRGLVLRAWPASAPSLSWRQPRRGGLHAGLDTTTVRRARRLRALICTNPQKTVKPSAILMGIAKETFGALMSRDVPRTPALPALCWQRCLMTRPPPLVGNPNQVGCIRPDANY